MTKRRNLVHHLTVYFFYFLLALVITWPLAQQLSTSFAGFRYGDGYEMAHHIWWFKYALQHGQPLYVQTLLGYPDGIPGVILWSDPLQFFPAWLFAFVLPLPAAANLTLLLTLALNGWAMYWLALHLLNNQRGPALLAGVVFLAFPTIQGHLAAGHGGLIVQWPVPLYVYCLIRLRDTAYPHPNPSPAASLTGRGAFHPFSLREKGPGDEGFQMRWFILGALFFFLSAGGHTLQVIYVLFPITVMFILALAVKRQWRALIRVLVTAAAGAIALAIFLLPVAQSTFGTSAYTDEGGAVRYSADLLGIITPSFRHPLFGQLGYTRSVLGVNLDEGSTYVGIIAALLVVIAIWKRKEARWWLALAVVAWVLSLGPLLNVLGVPVTITVDDYRSYVTLPWAVFQNLPPFKLARTPGRFDFTLALAVAALAGYGSSQLSAISGQPKRRTESLSENAPVGDADDLPLPDDAAGHEKGKPQRSIFSPSLLRWIVFAILISLIVFEYQFYWPLPTVSADIPQPVAALADRSDVRAVFDIPWDNLIEAKYALYLQTAHQHPMIAGHLTRQTPVDPAKLAILQQTLDPALLKAAGADIVIVHRLADPHRTMFRLARQQLGAPIYQDAQWAVFQVPVPASAPAFTALLPSQTDVADHADTYAYAPESGWAHWRAQLNADGRDVSLLLDGVVIQRWTVNGSVNADVAIPLSTAGYHTLTLAVQPPCPAHFDATLRCRSVQVVNPTLEGFTPGDLSQPIPFARGLTLLGAQLPQTAQPGQTISVSLWWKFDQPRGQNDVRFVHILDANNQSVGQADGTLGIQPAGSEWLETLNFTLPGTLPPGVYTIFTGWYTYPDLNRFPVLASTPHAEDGLAYVGTFSVP